MMPGPGPPPTEFYYYSIVFGIITGIIYAVVYAMIKKSIPGKTVKRGLYFGLLLFLIGIPHFLSLYILVNLPSLLLVYWTITGLIVNLIGGVIIAYIVK